MINDFLKHIYMKFLSLTDFWPDQITRILSFTYLRTHLIIKSQKQLLSFNCLTKMQSRSSYVIQFL